MPTGDRDVVFDVTLGDGTPATMTIYPLGKPPIGVPRTRWVQVEYVRAQKTVKLAFDAPVGRDDTDDQAAQSAQAALVDIARVIRNTTLRRR